MDSQNKKIFSEEELATITESVRRGENIINEKIKHINWLMGGVIIVLFVSVISMLIALGGVLWQAFTFRASTYQALVNKVTEQNVKIEEISRTLQELSEIINEIQVEDPVR